MIRVADNCQTQNIASVGIQCSGCGACSSVCPQKCISMKMHEDGFYYPMIHTSQCTYCGLCEKICPACKDDFKEAFRDIYAGYTKNPDVRHQSSSGGIFWELAHHILLEGGVVFGAAFDPDKKRVYHKSTDSIDLKGLMRSKYVQSIIDDDIYQEVCRNLRIGRTVLFAGTPCQVAGMRRYVQHHKIKGKFITIDFICHGVPSIGLFDYFVSNEELQKDARVTNVTFREKEKGWNHQVTKVYFQDETVHTYESKGHFYYYFFLRSYSLRNSCYTCKYDACYPADITLADFWTMPQNDNLGTSLLFVHSKTGEELLANISDKIFIEKDPDGVPNAAVYSHCKYNIKKKVKWERQVRHKGYDYLSTAYFHKIKKKEQRVVFIEKYIHKIKAFLRRILKGRQP